MLDLADVLEPLVAYLDPVGLVLLMRTNRPLFQQLSADDAAARLLWRVAAAAIGVDGASSRTDCADYFRREAHFAHDATFGGQVLSGGQRLILELGSALPITRRVAAATSTVSVARSSGRVGVDLRVCETPATHEDTLLWLGVMYHKYEPKPLNRATVGDALAGYDVTADPTNARVAERFSTSQWSLSAIGSNGSVSADGSVPRRLGPAFRFGPGDVVRVTIDMHQRELWVRVNTGPSERAVRRLLPRSCDFTPRVHLIAQLTDVACPKLARRARAVLEIGPWIDLPR